MAAGQKVAGGAQLVVLVVIAILLAIGFVVLDRYNAGEKDTLTVETRGLQMISSLSRYRQETGGYPDSLEALVPKHAPAVSRCPSGESMEYRRAGDEYVLACQKVFFKRLPHSYDSRARSWKS
jgi:type II secretory pathway pseudopilin PulG